MEPPMRKSTQQKPNGPEPVRCPGYGNTCPRGSKWPVELASRRHCSRDRASAAEELATGPARVRASLGRWLGEAERRGAPTSHASPLI